MIEFKAVSKTYNGKVKALDNMNFTVGDGELVGFIGPNGSGKTTTIKLLSGVLTPDKGTIKVNGFDVGKEPLKAKASIGYIADNPDVFLRLKGIEFLNFIVCDFLKSIEILLIFLLEQSVILFFLFFLVLLNKGIPINSTFLNEWWKLVNLEPIFDFLLLWSHQRLICILVSLLIWITTNKL